MKKQLKPILFFLVALSALVQVALRRTVDLRGLTAKALDAVRPAQRSKVGAALLFVRELLHKLDQIHVVHVCLSDA